MASSVIAVSMARHKRSGTIFTVIFDAFVFPHVIVVVCVCGEAFFTYIALELKPSCVQLHVLIQTTL